MHSGLAGYQNRLPIQLGVVLRLLNEPPVNDVACQAIMGLVSRSHFFKEVTSPNLESLTGRHNAMKNRGP